jgi:hypothetical protein
MDRDLGGTGEYVAARSQRDMRLFHPWTPRGRASYSLSKIDPFNFVEPSRGFFNPADTHFAVRREVALPEGFEPSYQP